MDFNLSEEQQLLKDSVTKLMAGRYSIDDRKGYAKSETGWSKSIWSQFAELGLLGVSFAEEYGGIGGGGIETMIVMEAFGKSLVIEPYFPTVVLCGGFLQEGGSEKQKSELIPQIIDGKLLMAFAQTERSSRYNLFDVATTARRDGDGWVIDGTKALVWHGDSADKLIVTARVSGQQRDRDGIGLFIVDAKAAGVSRKTFTLADSHRSADITFKSVKVGAGDVIGEPGQAAVLIERVVDRALAALSAEAVGAMDELLAITVDYLKTRQQFGRPIGTFQALQHRAVSMLQNLEQGRSMAMLAAMIAGDSDNSTRRSQISAAKVQINKSSRFVAEQAVQLHGGIAMTLEYKANHYVKRLHVLQTALGDVDHHMGLLSQLGSVFPPEE